MLTIINSNGSKFYGDQPDSIDTLIEVLQHETLDRTFEQYGNFISRKGKHVRFWGNFRSISHVFDIDTTDSDVIHKLTRAIRANQRTQAYLAQPKAKRLRQVR